MSRSMLAVTLLLALWPLSSQAQSARWYADRAWAQQGSQGRQQSAPNRQRSAGRGDDDRRIVLTPDERRELHRDLQRANREIYRKSRERSQRR